MAWFFRKAGFGVQGIVMATRGKPHEVANSQAQVRGSRNLLGEHKAAAIPFWGEAVSVIEYFKQLPELSEHSKQKQFPRTAPLK